MELYSPGSRIGRYEIVKKIAVGGMAEVYAARLIGHAGFERAVALKRMRAEIAEDERFVQMFVDEARIASHIVSPHVVQTLDFGAAEDNSLYIVMGLVRGPSLSSLLKAAAREKTKLPIPVVIEIIRQTALGLHHAHETRSQDGLPLNIIHRDVSPQNILVGVDGRVRITDFGVAKALYRKSKTSTGEIKGKIAYVSPEQLRAKDLDRRTDIFSLGIVLWEALVGKRLFESGNPAATIAAILEQQVESPTKLRGEIPVAVSEVVKCALERDPDSRFGTMLEFANALGAAAETRFADQKLAEWIRENATAEIRQLNEALAATSVSRPPSTKTKRPSKMWFALAALPTLCTIGFYELSHSPDIGADRAPMAETTTPVEPSAEPPARAEPAESLGPAPAARAPDEQEARDNESDESTSINSTPTRRRSRAARTRASSMSTRRPQAATQESAEEEEFDPEIESEIDPQRLSGRDLFAYCEGDQQCIIENLVPRTPSDFGILIEAELSSGSTSAADALILRLLERFPDSRTARRYAQRRMGESAMPE